MKIAQRLPKMVSGLLAASMLFTVFGSAALADSSSSSLPFDDVNGVSDEALADDSILLMLAPHTDRTAVIKELETTINAKTIVDIHADRDDYSILRLQPADGQYESTYKKLFAMRQDRKEFVAQSRNYLLTAQALPTENCKNAPGPVRVSGGPNDPYLPYQWPLINMNWVPAWHTFRSVQRRAARITIIGVPPQAVPGELTPDLEVYNALTNATTPLIPIPPSTSPEGSIDSSLTGALTNNGTLISGAACFSPRLPCHITIAQIQDPPYQEDQNLNLSDVIQGVCWALNHQDLRGGPGPISSSHNAHITVGDPTSGPCGSQSYWLNPMLQKLATSLKNQGDLLIESAGDFNCLNTLGSGKWATGDIVSVQGTDPSNNYLLGYFPNTPNGDKPNGLTRIKGCPFAAPGTELPSLRGNVVFCNQGSSNSAPLWASAVAMVMAFNPSLTAKMANDIIERTGTPVRNSPWPAVIPNFYRAINFALHH